MEIGTKVVISIPQRAGKPRTEDSGVVVGEIATQKGAFYVIQRPDGSTRKARLAMMRHAV